MSQNNHKAHGPYEKFFKWLFDVVFSFLALLILSLILLVIAILVRIKLGSPVLFKQERPGKNEKIFKLYKFRTMTDARDAKGRLLSDEKRLTRFGRLLRSSSLDELPELFNILKGDMSFVGPRPLLVEYLPYYTKKEHHRHDVRPGLTGWAQVNGRNLLKWNEKLNLDLDYINKVSLLFDLKIIALTVKKVLFREDIQMGNDLKFGRLDVERRKR
ncbi:sugar transferase [Candidatus Saccharibacteria bacterium]|nr:sugar transferase [Candidatus Saccharibacteria bacterium]